MSTIGEIAILRQGAISPIVLRTLFLEKLIR
jgi:hypothetical protein